MKDITSTSFGLVMAYLLPGLVGLYGASFWLPPIRQMLRTFLTVQSNVGLFLIAILVALIIGLLVTAFRGLIFEHWFCRSDRLGSADFANLAIEAKLVAFRAAVDEHYRYHQFWGGMTVVMPIPYAGWLKESWSILNTGSLLWTLVVLVALEVLSGWAAIVAYRIFVTRAREILRKGG